VFEIASFYRFSAIADPATHRVRLQEVAQRHDVTGTILIATEGINGTIAGTHDGVASVVDGVRATEGFEDLDVRRSGADFDPFLRLKVRHKREIVSLGVADLDTPSLTGRRIPPALWNEMISDPAVIVVDARNDYEVAIGTFENARNPDIESFRELPEWVDSQSDLTRESTIAMFCTGGIRCEKASAYLAERGFDNVVQLDGGILSYLDEVPAAESLWKGECYVFDRRVSVGFGLRPGTSEICPNCNEVVQPHDRDRAGYETGVTCHRCVRHISDDRLERFRERQHQIEIATERGVRHLGRSG